MTNLPALGAPPTLRALLCGTALYGGTAHGDLYCYVGRTWPDVLTGDRPGLYNAVGCSWPMTELLFGVWDACAKMMAERGKHSRVTHRVFQSQLLVAFKLLRGMLDARPAEDIELDWAYGLPSPLDDLRGRLALILYMMGEASVLDELMRLLWAHARRSTLGQGYEELYATALGASILDGSYTSRHIPGTDLIDVLEQWREEGREAFAVVANINRAAVRDAVAEAMTGEKAAPRPTPLKHLAAIRAQQTAEPATPPGSAVLFPSSILEGVGRSDNQKELKRILGDVLDKALPGVRVPSDWDAWERALLARHPNGGAFFRAIRRSQGAREFWGHAVVCADGPAGAGKSAMCRSVAEVSGLRMKRYQCDNTSDNSYGGTPIRWASSQQDFVTGAFVEFKQRSFVAALDEVEKGGGSRDSNSGKLHDALLGQLDPETAAAWPSNFLCHPVDLTGVIFLCTANDAASMPAPLRDRMVIARVDEPTADHLAVLAPQVAREVCRRQGLDERWGALDATEMASLADAWPGGSIRRLVRLVEFVLQARDEGPAAAPRH